MEDNFKLVYLYSIRLLARQSYSRFKLKRKIFLKFPDIDSSIHNNVISFLEEKKYLNEHTYTCFKIISLANKNNSLTNIQRLLEQEEIYFTVKEIEEILANEHIFINKILSCSIAKYIIKKNITLSNFQSKQKVFYHFSQKGHSYSEIQLVLTSSF